MAKPREAHSHAAASTGDPTCASNSYTAKTLSVGSSERTGQQKLVTYQTEPTRSSCLEPISEGPPWLEC